FHGSTGCCWAVSLRFSKEPTGFRQRKKHRRRRIAPPTRPPPTHHFLLSGIETQAERPNDPVKVVFPVIFDFDPPAVFPVVQGEWGRDMLRESILQFAARGIAQRGRPPLALAARPAGPELSPDHAFGRPYGGTLAQDFFGQQSLFVVRF